jgi:hypothetical protein
MVNMLVIGVLLMLIVRSPFIQIIGFSNKLILLSFLHLPLRLLQVPFKDLICTQELSKRTQKSQVIHLKHKSDSNLFEDFGHS